VIVLLVELMETFIFLLFVGKKFKLPYSTKIYIIVETTYNIYFILLYYMFSLTDLQNGDLGVDAAVSQVLPGGLPNSQLTDEKLAEQKKYIDTYIEAIKLIVDSENNYFKFEKESIDYTLHDYKRALLLKYKYETIKPFLDISNIYLLNNTSNDLGEVLNNVLDDDLNKFTENVTVDVKNIYKSFKSFETDNNLANNDILDTYNYKSSILAEEIILTYEILMKELENLSYIDSDIDLTDLEDLLSNYDYFITDYKKVLTKWYNEVNTLLQNNNNNNITDDDVKNFLSSYINLFKILENKVKITHQIIFKINRIDELKDIYNDNISNEKIYKKIFENNNVNYYDCLVAESFYKIMQGSYESIPIFDYFVKVKINYDSIDETLKDDTNFSENFMNNYKNNAYDELKLFQSKDFEKAKSYATAANNIYICAHSENTIVKACLDYYTEFEKIFMTRDI
jgi:hypothetical protein